MSHLPKSILVPVTLDSTSRHSLQVAAEMAAAMQATLHVLYVWEAPYAPEDVTAESSQRADGDLFERMRARCASELVAFIESAGLNPASPSVKWTIHSGHPATEILSHSRAQACDLILMGTHRKRGLEHWLLGSVAEEVLRHAPCSVLVVPGRSASE
ncbi:MAG TPA: universal stress protein [Polyangiaceae bacterium]|jgi:nucleotide-binding universal stress UspA family protein|nr:universal stress protein [Polyangiaceae bacterium]